MSASDKLGAEKKRYVLDLQSAAKGTYEGAQAADSGRVLGKGKGK